MHDNLTKKLPDRNSSLNLKSDFAVPYAKDEYDVSSAYKKSKRK